MTLTQDNLYENLYQSEMIREPGNPGRKDNPLKNIGDVQKFVKKCGGSRPAFMSIYSYIEPYKVHYTVNSKGVKERIAEYSPIIFDRIILDFDIDKIELLAMEGYNSEDLKNKGEELLIEKNKQNPEDRQIKITKKLCIEKGKNYYMEQVKQDDQDAIKEITKKSKTKKARYDAIMEYYYQKYTSKEYLITPYKEAIKTANYIKELFNLTPLLFFSAGHGIHLHILFNPVEVPNPNDIVENFGVKLEKELNLTTLDTTVVQGVNKHLIRIPLSRHQQTKLYVVPFDLKTDYLTVMDYAKEPVVNVDLDFNQDTTIFENFIKSYSKFLEETETTNKNKIIEVDYKYELDGSLFDLQEPFSRIYTEGQRNYTAHPLIHFFKGAGIPKEEVEEFFDTLPVGTGLDNNVQSWINTAYNTNKPYQDNMGYFINTVKQYGHSQEDIDHIIKKFNEYFNRKGKETTKDLTPFKIGTDATKYKVKATIVDNKYNRINIIDLVGVKGFNFVFDIYNNTCKLEHLDKNMIFEFKYQFNPGGFKIKSKTEFNQIKKDILDTLNIKIPVAFEYSLASYLSGLYNEIEAKNITPEIDAKIEELTKTINNENAKNLVVSIQENFEERSRAKVEAGRRELSELLTDYYGVILRKHMGTLYMINGNGYEPTTHDDLINELTKLFGKNFIHDTDLKNAIGYISDRLEPTPNIIKFENTLFDMNTIEPIESNAPIFTVLNIPYNYNPNAKSSLFKQFLTTTFERDTKEETDKAVKGIKQLCGYFLTSGNTLEILPIFTGLTGAGKSTLLNILTGIIGHDKISGISLQSLENDIHSSSGFIGRHLNIIRDSDTAPIKNNAIIKSLTGNEAYTVNPKFKDLFDLPAEEVPKQILACNTMPVFVVYEDSIIRRFVIVEFLVSMTKKGEDIPDLDKKILADQEEVEWFIYESLKEYKSMIENEETFIFKISDEETKELIEKHTHPLNHIIHMLISKHDPIAYDEDKMAMKDYETFTPVFTNELVEVILQIANDKGIDIPVDKHGKINKKTLLGVIRDEFDLHDGEIVKDKETGQYSKHREYTARNERFNGRNAKAYPNLMATELYKDTLKKIKEEKQKKMEEKKKDNEE